MQPQVASASPSPAFDESTFQQILRAAYVIQQQNDARREKRANLDPGTTLAVIAETQGSLQFSHDVSGAANLIVKQLEKVTSAEGAAIAVIADDELTYCAATGSCASLAGHTGPIGASIADFLKEERTLHRSSNDPRHDLLDRHDNSPALFPIYHEGTIAGLLQLSFAQAESIQEHEIRSCQLMAGLIGEVISRAAELEWKQTLASERATMLEALERLRPQLEHLAAQPTKADAKAPGLSSPAPEMKMNGGRNGSSSSASSPDVLPPELSAMLSKLHPGSVCSRCGFEFGEDEMFCGRCGTPRTLDITAPTDFSDEPHPDSFPIGEMQPLPFPEPDEGIHESALVLPPSAAVQPALAQASTNLAPVEGSAALAIDEKPGEIQIADDSEQQTGLEIVPEPEKSPAPSPWSSAKKARTWLESVRQKDSQWLSGHVGDISVVLAGFVLMLVLLHWNANIPQNKLAHSKTPPQPSLTLFERMLVGLGLAEPPPTPVYKGNPNTQVWEDLHTGLYYCANADLYGKTPGGKVASQRDAQLDQFEPAGRRTCE